MQATVPFKKKKTVVFACFSWKNVTWLNNSRYLCCGNAVVGDIFLFLSTFRFFSMNMNYLYKNYKF